MEDCYKCGFWDHDREGCTCPAPDRAYACPIVTETRRKEKSDIERMRDELNKFCRSFVVCKQNGKQCPLYGYCSVHPEFMDKDVKRLYYRMKKKLEADDGKEN